MKQTNNSLIDIVQPDMLFNSITAADILPSSPHFAKPNVRWQAAVLDAVFVFVAKGLWKRLQDKNGVQRLAVVWSVCAPLIPDFWRVR